MTEKRFELTPEILLQHGHFLRKIARGLLRDEYLAEDALQESWLAALEQRPHPVRWRAWLTRVTRNIAIKTLRTRERANARETKAARPERSNATHPRELLLRSVVDAVLGLREPYRSTVFMRCFEDVSVADIAAREGVAEVTIRSRLRRALAQLRERLDAEHGERRCWLEGLGTMTGFRLASVTSEALPAGGSLIVLKLVAAAALVVAATAGLWGWLRPEPSLPESPPTSGELDAKLAPPEHVESPLSVPEQTAPVRTAIEDATARTEIEKARSDDSDPPHVHGSVTDREGHHIAQARITLYDFECADLQGKMIAEITTDGKGAFSLSWHGVISPDPHTRKLIVADKEGFAIGFVTWCPLCDPPFERTIRLRLPSSASGRVLDQSGHAVVGAEVIALLTMDDNEIELWGVRSCEFFATTTDPAGRFAFQRVPPDAQVNFIVSAQGFGTQLTNATDDSLVGFFSPDSSDIVITMQPEAVIEGVTVVKESGEPVPGVSLFVMPEFFDPRRNRTIVSDESGAFRIGALTSGTYSIYLSPDWPGLEQWTMSSVDLEVEAGERTGNVRLELSPGGVLEFLVTDANTAMPIHKATVHVNLKGGEPLHDSTWGRKDSIWADADMSGVARLPLDADRYPGYEVEAEGYLPSRSEEGVVIESGRTTRVAVGLSPAPRIRGIAVDSGGEPVSGADFAVTASSMSWSRIGETTGASGEFEIAWYPGEPEESAEDSRGEIILNFYHSERNLVGHGVVENPDAPVRVVLVPGIVLKGRVVDEHAISIAGASVQVEHDSEVTTDLAGSYEIPAIAPHRSLTLRAEAKGYAWSVIEVETGEATGVLELQDIVLERADLGVSGVVLDVNGKPVPRARLSVTTGPRGERQMRITRPETKSAVDGTFEISGLTAGTVSLQAFKSPDGNGQLEAEAGETDLRLVVRFGMPDFGSVWESLNRPRPQLLRDHQLLRLDRVKFDRPPSFGRGERVLVCLYDMNKLASRQLVKDLNERAFDLAQRDVFIVGLDASENGLTVLSDWAKDKGLRFPVGALEDDVDLTLHEWGTRGDYLPWLVLTDRGHIVRAEGFPFDQLDLTLDGLGKE
ncbi:MAG: sigma-70 family RNA polymerase sigma factor [Planctomycetota bacterium]